MDTQIKPEIKIEKDLIWRMIVNADEIPEVVDLISPDDFMSQLYRNAYQTILKLHNENRLIDLNSIYLEMGRPDKISNLIQETDDCFFPASHYANVLKQRNLENDILRASKEREYDEVQKNINELKLLGKPTDIRTLTEIIEKGEVRNEVFATRYCDLDSIVKLECTDLMILAGRSSVGKSILGSCMLANMAKYIPVGLISFEMTEIKIVGRLMQSYSTEYLNEINRNFIITSPITFNLSETRKAIHAMKMKKGIKVVMVDYLQLMSETKEYRSRHLEISHTIRQLKAMAREFQVAMIVVSSLNRGIDQKAEKAKPALGDLKESGDIEYCADEVCFLHREPKQENADLIVAKNRNGKTGIIKLVWLKEKICYGNYEWQRNGN